MPNANHIYNGIFAIYRRGTKRGEEATLLGCARGKTKWGALAIAAVALGEDEKRLLGMQLDYISDKQQLKFALEHELTLSPTLEETVAAITAIKRDMEQEVGDAEVVPTG